MNKNVPKLRFKGFSDEWEEKKLKDIADIVGGGTPYTTENNYWNGQVQWFTPSEIGKSKYIESSIRTITELGVKKSSAKILPIGTILLTSRATLGEMAILKKEGTTNQGFQSLVVKKNYNTEFIYYLKNQISRYCYKNASGSTFLEISKSNLEKCKIKIPSLEEQEKIANFLSNVDKIIEEQEGKVKDLELYKKGMMQKIFKQEIRFKDDTGIDYPEWEEKIIKDIFDITRGQVIAKTSISPVKIDKLIYPVYSSQTSNYGILGYDSKYDFEGEFLTWTTDGANAGKVFKRNGKFRCTNVCGLLVEKDITKGFANECIKEILEKETPKHVSYVGNPKLMNGVMGDITINIPCLEEQKKIAEFLSNIDNIVEEENKKLEDLRQLKKGLLQQMFV